MFDLSEKIEDIGYWVMLPTVRLTETSRKKWVRVLGVVAVFPLFPLIVLSMPIMLVAMVIGMYESI